MEKGPEVEQVWPEGVRELTFDETGEFGIRDRDGQLYWRGKPVQTKNLLSLRGFELTLLAIVAFAAAIGTFVNSWSWFCELGWLLQAACPAGN